jgi:hypothetical protein
MPIYGMEMQRLKLWQREIVCRFCSRSSCYARCNGSNGFVAIHASGKKKVAVPSTVHADHLIQAKVGATKDLQDL